jgi:hypothetical protein
MILWVTTRKPANQVGCSYNVSYILINNMAVVNGEVLARPKEKV